MVTIFSFLMAWHFKPAMLLHTSLVFIWRENRSGILQIGDFAVSRPSQILSIRPRLSYRGCLRFMVSVSRENLWRSGNCEIPERLGFSRMLGFSSVVQTDVEGLLLLGLTDKDENLSSYKRDTQFTEPVPYIWKKMAKIDTLFIQYNTTQGNTLFIHVTSRSSWSSFRIFNYHQNIWKTGYPSGPI